MGEKNTPKKKKTQRKSHVAKIKTLRSPYYIYFQKDLSFVPNTLYHWVELAIGYYWESIQQNTHTHTHNHTKEKVGLSEEEEEEEEHGGGGLVTRV